MAHDAAIAEKLLHMREVRAVDEPAARPAQGSPLPPPASGLFAPSAESQMITPKIASVAIHGQINTPLCA